MRFERCIWTHAGAHEDFRFMVTTGKTDDYMKLYGKVHDLLLAIEITRIELEEHYRWHLAQE
jgi:hypothetical protein